MPLQDIPAFIRVHERWALVNRWELSYLFFPCEKSGGRMLVLFGGNQNYGYLRSFYEREIGSTHLLFLRDNLGPDGASLWWMADRGDFGVGEAYGELIRDCAEECGVLPQDIYFLGNCSGGFGALYLSFLLGEGHALALAPYIAVGSVYEGSPLVDRIVGTSGVDLDEYIFNHFDRPSEVQTHIYTANSDGMMRRGRLSRFILLLFRRGNLFSLRNLRIDHPEDINVHTAICSGIPPEEILEELGSSLVYSYHRSKRL